jgi:phage-related protein
MSWVVELLYARVRNEVEALPADMKARFRRIVELIQVYGLEQCASACKTSGRASVGDADKGEGRHLSSELRNDQRPPHPEKTQKTPRGEINLAMQRLKEPKDNETYPR